VDYDFYSFDDLAFAHKIALDGLRQKNATIHFQVLRPEFYAISASTPDGLDHYLRYHRHSGGLLGFMLVWRNSQSHLHVERVATLMSGSLWASATGAPFPRVPSLSRPAEAVVARPLPPQAPQPVQPTTTPPQATQEARRASSGTGFFVSLAGHVLTNAHVVDGCNSISVTPDGGAPLVARLVARDTTNDLALLQVSHMPRRIAAIRSGARLGESVAAFGFPLASLLASSGNFTLGNVTALAGIADDSRFMQMSAPVQPGNSGGPLFDNAGNVVGIVTAKLNAVRTMVATNGDIPQNVNFAIKASVATNFLETNRVNVQVGQATAAMQPADLADHARTASVFIRCQ
jgi:S1-C subfamily serine protease